MTHPKPLTRRSGTTPPGGPVASAPVVVVAIAGASGSGKTWLARALARALRPHAGVVSLDDFYRDLAALPLARRERVNFDAPEAIDWELFDACLDRIRAGRPVALPQYDFESHSRRPSPRRWILRNIVLVEGLWPWSQRAQERHYAVRLFRDAPAALRLARRLERDQHERGRHPRSVRQQWTRHAEPMRRIHVDPQAASADLVLGAEIAPAELARIAAFLRELAGLPDHSPASPKVGSRPRQSPRVRPAAKSAKLGTDTDPS